VIVGNEVEEVRLWLRDGPQNEPLAIILPLDDDLPTRAEAALRLWTRIVGRRADHGREPLALTRQRCDRLVLMLRALDGHLSEASYREIAEVLFGIRRLERAFPKLGRLTSHSSVTIPPTGSACPLRATHLGD
jgi:T6SS, Transcription factor, DNA binding domain